MPADTSTGHSERLFVPPGWWLLGLGMWMSAVWVLVVATPVPVVIVGAALVAVAVVGALLTYGGVRVDVRDGALHAGHGSLPTRYIARVEVCGPDEVRRLVGTDADARAFLVVRSYVPGAIRVWLDDPRDPVPYWLVSSRRPDTLAASLDAQLVRH